MEIKVNIPRAGLEPQQVTINLPPRTREDKKKLLSLSDKDLAQLDAEELEQVRRAKANLVEIMKTDREVSAMVQQEQLEQRIEEYMAAKGLSREQAELLAKQDFGLMGPSNVGPLFIQPPEDSLYKAFKEALSERIKDFFPSGADTKGGQRTETTEKGPDLSQALKTAKEQGVNSLFLPDGTRIEINPKDPLGDELVNEALTWVKGQLPSIFGGGGGAGGKVSGELLASENPEIVKLGLEYRGKQEERKAAEIIAKARTDTTREVATLLATMVSPEGYQKVKAMFEEVTSRVRGGAEGADRTAEVGEDKIGLACLNCHHVNMVQKGTPSFTCENCGAENEQDWE